MLNSLKFKLTFLTVLIISVIMTLSTFRDIRQTELKLLDSQKEKAVLLSDRISHSIMVLMLQNKWKDLQSMMESLVSDAKDLKKIQVFRPENGHVVVSSDPEEIGTKLFNAKKRFVRDEVRDAFLINRGGQRFASKVTIIENQRICYRCHGSEKKVLGVLSIEISLSDITKTIEEFKRERLTETLVGFLLISGGIIVVVVIFVNRPINNMIRTIRKIEDGDLSARMKEEKNDEFGLVARSFNSMLKTLESANTEIEMCHAEQMQRAAKLASLGEIVSGIAHEIKNPLTGISCAVQVIQSEMREDDGNREITTEILNHIKRLDSTVKDLLNYAKPKPPSFMPLKIDDVLDKAVFFVYPEAKKQNVVIETDIVEPIPDVMMDPDQIQQVLLNLLINAIQAMQGGGELKIMITAAEKNIDGISDALREKLAGDLVLIIKLKDTGKGIEPEYVESIFDPFFTRKSKGTGLGLSISQRIIQEHGGEITVSSTLGEGSEFTLYLPAIEAAGGEQA